MKSLSIKSGLIGIIALIALSAIFFSNINLAGANPSTWSRKQSAAATTTVTYLVRASSLATTTVAVDTGNGGNNAIESANLAVQLTASSTTSTLTWRYEYAMPPVTGENCVDNEAACDWYSNDLVLFTSATTTQNLLLSVPITQSWIYSSTTDFCGGIAQTVANAGNRRCKMFQVPVGGRYIRAVFSSNSAQNMAVWAEWLTRREQ